MGKSSKKPDLGGNLNTLGKSYSQSYLQMLLDSKSIDLTQAQSAGYKDQEAKQVADTIFTESVVSSTMQKLALMNGGSFSPPPLPTEPTNGATGTSDMSALTEQNRKNSEKVRICDLREGDKLGWIPQGMSAVNNKSGIVAQSITEPDSWAVSWNGATATEDDWRIPKNSTKLLTNWVDHGTPVFLVSENANNNPAPVVAKVGGVDFDSVILHEDKKKQILDTISQVDNYDLIFKQWGFSEIFEKGTAIAMLFYGEPGTGKTLMAQAIADKYGKKLTMVSTAEIETPEPGGAERNLKKYFEEADSSHSVLLFDECDSLITDRKRVGMILAAQINALLSELEKYKGIVVFTTNRLDALDPAFERRLSLKLEFPMPDKAHRLHIWKRMFPTRAPLDKNIRWDDLASIKIAGGHIKNVVLASARMAAANGDKEITDKVLWDCLEKEVAARDAYKDALDSNQQFYGTALPNQGRGLDLNRVRGKGRQIG